MHWNVFALVYMTIFFGLVLGTVVYAVIHIAEGDRGRRSRP